MVAELGTGASSLGLSESLSEARAAGQLDAEVSMIKGFIDSLEPYWHAVTKGSHELSREYVWLLGDEYAAYCYECAELVCWRISRTLELGWVAILQSGRFAPEDRCSARRAATATRAFLELSKDIIGYGLPLSYRHESNLTFYYSSFNYEELSWCAECGCLLDSMAGVGTGDGEWEFWEYEIERNGSIDLSASGDIAELWGGLLHDAHWDLRKREEGAALRARVFNLMAHAYLDEEKAQKSLSPDQLEKFNSFKSARVKSA